jgi:hypothetical protein
MSNATSSCPGAKDAVAQDGATRLREPSDEDLVQEAREASDSEDVADGRNQLEGDQPQEAEEGSQEEGSEQPVVEERPAGDSTIRRSRRRREGTNDDENISNSIPSTTEELLVKLLEETRRLHESQEKVSAILEKTFKPEPSFAEVEKISNGFKKRKDKFEGLGMEFFTKLAPGKNTLKAARYSFDRWIFGHREVVFPWCYDLFIGDSRIPSSPLEGETRRLITEHLDGIWPKDWVVSGPVCTDAMNNTMDVSHHSRSSRYGCPCPKRYLPWEGTPVLDVRNQKRNCYRK